MRKLAAIFGLVILITGCDGVVDFAKIPRTNLKNSSDQLIFEYQEKSAVFEQNSYDKNEVSFSFQAFDDEGAPIEDIVKDNIVVRENGVLVKDFEFSLDSVKEQRVVDIVFVLDSTRSMTEELRMVKDNISKFVDELALMNLKANLCLVTFGDHVRKSCEGFHEDDPLTPENENLNQFKRDVSKVKLVIGGDLFENPMGALIHTAETTPWHNGAQRLTVLITDEDYHTDKNPGDAGSDAPAYADVLETLKKNKTMVFAIAPDLPGYSTPLEDLEPITSVTGGGFFDFDNLEGSGLNDVFGKISDKFRFNYNVKYQVEENKLDPRLKLENRKLSVEVDHLNTKELLMQPARSTMPAGRAVYLKTWHLSDFKGELHKVKVTMDGRTMTSGFSIREGKIHFDEVPAPGAKMAVSFEDGQLVDMIDYVEYVKYWPYEDYDVFVTLNGNLIGEAYYKVRRNEANHLVVDLTSLVFEDEDVFDIRKKGGLSFKVEIKEYDRYVRKQ